MKEYLNDAFKYVKTDSGIDFYKVSVPGKGEMLAEYNNGDNTVSLVHVDRNGRLNNYEAFDTKELRDTVEYCLGPIVTESQWRHATAPVVDDGEDWDLVTD